MVRNYIASLLAAIALPASALDFCPSVGKVEPPAGKMEPCEGLAFLAKITAKCAAEIPEDKNLQRHAAGILELERQVKIDQSVTKSLQQMRAKPQPIGGRPIDPAAMDRQIAFQESYAAKNRDALAEKRALAVSAGYSQLGQEGTAQAVISNAVWRYMDNAVQPHLTACSQSEAGKRAAGEFAGALAMSFTHGNPLEQQIIRQLLDK